MIEELNGRRWGEGDFNKETNKLIYNSKREPNAKWIRMKAGEKGLQSTMREWCGTTVFMHRE